MRHQCIISTAVQEVIDQLEVSYHHTPALPKTTLTAPSSYQRTLSIRVGFVEEYTGTATAAKHCDALSNK